MFICFYVFIKFKTWTGKYNDAIYYIAPFYHDIFPTLDKLVVTDVDIEFQVDPVELYKEFDHFSKENVVGVANELSPHYFHMLQLNGYFNFFDL